MSQPAISLVAWEDRKADQVFVAIPDERGRYLRTDRSVAFVDCPSCGSAAGEPCKNRLGRYNGGTHYQRRHRASKAGCIYPRRADDILDQAPSTPDEHMEFGS